MAISCNSRNAQPARGPWRETDILTITGRIYCVKNAMGERMSDGIWRGNETSIINVKNITINHKAEGTKWDIIICFYISISSTIYISRSYFCFVWTRKLRMLCQLNNVNFRGKYKDTKCRKCPENIEAQEHVLETCPGIYSDPSTKITTNEIFENDTKKTKLRIY